MSVVPVAQKGVAQKGLWPNFKGLGDSDKIILTKTTNNYKINSGCKITLAIVLLLVVLGITITNLVLLIQNESKCVSFSKGHHHGNWQDDHSREDHGDHSREDHDDHSREDHHNGHRIAPSSHDDQISDNWKDVENPFPEFKTDKQEEELPPFEFDDMYNVSYRPKYVAPAWVGKTNKVSYMKDGDFVVFDLDTNSSEIIMSSDILADYAHFRLEISPDETHVLMTYDTIRAVATAVSSRYAIYDIKTSSLYEFPHDSNMKGKTLLYAGFASMGHTVSFIYKEDLYYQEDGDSAPVRLTTSGEISKQRNGFSYFNYEGVLLTGPAHWFSPDMKYLAYGSFDSRNTYTSELPIYGDSDKIYPYVFNQVYLKSGDTGNFSNAVINVMPFNISGETSTITIDPPEVFKNRDHYFYHVMWRDSTHLAISWCDRRQQHSLITICNVEDNTCQLTDDRTYDGGWIISSPIKQFIDDGEVAIGVLPYDIEDRGPYQQVAMISTPTTDVGNVVYLTISAIDVYRVIGYDSERHLVYYESSGGMQLSRHIYRVGTPAADPELQNEMCVTCDYICNYNNGYTSFSADYLIQICQGPGIPQIFIKGLKDDFTYTIEDNTALSLALSKKAMPPRYFTSVMLDDGNTGYAEFIYPPNMVRNGSVQYPLLLFPYGGPQGHTQADFQYKTNNPLFGGWENYLASSLGIVVVRVNGRGTAGRGNRWLYSLYRSVGTYEVQDQIAAARHIGRLFPYIDENKIAIYGLSYGGFLATHAIGDTSDVIKCGLAVAPVTNFRYYFAGFTERYMDLDTPDDNEAGYNATDATRKAENFKNKKYFIAHGSLDDNVHFQNAMQLIHSLSEAQVMFRTQVYTDENHGFQNTLNNRHLFLSMTDFLKNDCFNL